MYQHGDFQIQLSGNVLHVKASGSWNTVTANAFVEEYKAVAQPTINQTWAVYNDFRDWELAPPEVNPIIKDLIHWIFTNGQTASVYVTPPSALRIFQFTEMAAGLELPAKYQFYRTESEHDAISWLNKLGFVADPSIIKSFNI